MGLGGEKNRLSLLQPFQKYLSKKNHHTWAKRTISKIFTCIYNIMDSTFFLEFGVKDYYLQGVKVTSLFKVKFLMGIQNLFEATTNRDTDFP